MSFESYEKEISNALNPEDNGVVLIDPNNPSQKAGITAAGELKVIVTGGGNQVTDGQAIVGGETAIILAGRDGTDYQHLIVDTDGHLQIDILTLPLPTDASTETKQDSQITELQAIKTALQILDDWDETNRAKVNPVVGQVGLAAGTGVDASNALRISLATNIPLPAGTNRIGEIRLVDANDVDLDVALDTTRPANTRALLITGVDLNDVVRVPTVSVDDEDSKHRLAIEGKISISIPAPPPAATPKTFDAATTLDVVGTDDTDFEITDGKTFTLQQVTGGAEGDPTEKGAKIEVLYVDGSSVEHIIDRIYLSGATVQTFPDTSTARDGTSLDGDADAGTGLIRIRREQFGGGTREIDVVVRGFEI